MASASNVEFSSSLEDPLELQSSDTEEDESLDKNVYVIECLDDEFIKHNYKDIQNIGKGGFGSVYSAQQRIDSRRCALKIVPINMETFDKREVEVLLCLKLKNIIEYHTCMVIKLQTRKSLIYPKLSSEKDASDGIIFRDGNSHSCYDNFTNRKESKKSSCKRKNDEKEIIDGCLVIQTELWGTGINLRTLIKRGDIFKMEDSIRCDILLDVTSGLQLIHDEGFMHRDLKPSNIFIGQDYRAKIGDMGLARKYSVPFTNEADEAGICFSKGVGTSLYVAPEVEGSTSYDQRADLYSLGMIIFETFHQMNSGRERLETLEKLRKQNFEDLSKFPEQDQNIKRIVESLLNHEPSMRMQLERVITLLSSPLGHQQSVEKARIVAQPVTSPDKEYPGATSSIQGVEEAQISEQISTMPQKKPDPPFDFKDTKDNIKIHLNKNMHPDKED